MSLTCSIRAGTCLALLANRMDVFIFFTSTSSNARPCFIWFTADVSRLTPRVNAAHLDEEHDLLIRSSVHEQSDDQCLLHIKKREFFRLKHGIDVGRPEAYPSWIQNAIRSTEHEDATGIA